MKDPFVAIDPSGLQAPLVRCFLRITGGGLLETDSGRGEFRRFMPIREISSTRPGTQ